MTYKYIINPVELSKKIILDYIDKDMIVCDCTVGNGNDTLFLANLVGDGGRVYGFDIQEEAIANTKDKLRKSGLLERVKLFRTGHENIDDYISDTIDLFIYNLGYLPKGDKKIITRADTTIKSIYKSLDLLKNNGILLVTCYTGHEGGLGEKVAVENYLSSLNQKEYNVLEFNFKNQEHSPPILYMVEKK